MKTHLKRIAAPKTWPIARKETTFITRPKPKGQAIEFTLPVVVIMRDMLKVVETKKQAKTVMRTQGITVNGRKVYNPDDAVGFMDVLQVGKESYRLLINEKKILTMVPTKSKATIQKITGKTHLKGGKMQLNLVGGMNVLIAKDTYKVGDSVALENGKITSHYALDKGASVLVTGGSHIGTMGSIDKVEEDTLTVKADKDSFQTTKDNAYVIGKDKPAI